MAAVKALKLVDEMAGMMDDEMVVMLVGCRVG
jgi:hypothetical protein